MPEHIVFWLAVLLYLCYIQFDLLVIFDRTSGINIYLRCLGNAIRFNTR
jgi:hypothetical protein